MPSEPRFVRVHALAERLGDPCNPSAPLSYEQSARWDEEEHYPQEALDLLQELGVWREFVPTNYGGSFTGYDELLYVARIVAARDLTVAVTMSAMAWSTLLWIGADEELKREHASSILAGHTPCLAYSEEAHGADLLASDTVARKIAGGYRLTGRKWPINRATTGQSVVLLARTGQPRDSRGLSLFWFEKSTIDPSRVRSLPRAPTVGVRGCDISGIEFEDAFIPDSRRIGEEGLGLELALKGFHITRTLCAGLSLGCMDAALRTTVRLARTRRLYENAMLALPQVRWELVEAYALLRALDAASLAAVRMLHVSPGQSALVSAIAKHVIPSVAEEVLSRLTTIHGARFYLRNHHDWGVIQKAFRDNLLVSIFDGSSPVNLHALASQLSLVARFAPKSLGGRREDGTRERDAFERAARACSFDQAPPDFDWSRLDLVSRGADDVIGSLASLQSDIASHVVADDLSQLLMQQMNDMVVEVREILALFGSGAEGTTRGGSDAPARAAAAARYAVLHIATSAIHVWWRSAFTCTRTVEPWLVIAVARFLGSSLAVSSPHNASSLADELLPELLDQSDRADGYLFNSTRQHKTAPEKLAWT